MTSVVYTSTIIKIYFSLQGALLINCICSGRSVAQTEFFFARRGITFYNTILIFGSLIKEIENIQMIFIIIIICIEYVIFLGYFYSSTITEKWDYFFYWGRIS